MMSSSTSKHSVEVGVTAVSRRCLVTWKKFQGQVLLELDKIGSDIKSLDPKPCTPNPTTLNRKLLEAKST